MLVLGGETPPQHEGDRHGHPKLRSRARSRNPTSAQSPNRSVCPTGPPRGSCPSNGRIWLSRCSPELNPFQTLAREHEVSRKFLYHQADTAREALSQAFHPQPKDEEVLFYLPVTNAWLRQLVLALVLVCHAPYRAVVEFFRDLLDWHISLGSVHNIVRSAVEPARAISGRINFAGVGDGALDEIFQAQKPVLVGVNTASTYCFLLVWNNIAMPTPGASTCSIWWLRASIPRGPSPMQARVFAPVYAEALPHVPCQGDVFHIVTDLKKVVSFLENRAYGASKPPNNASAGVTGCGDRPSAAAPSPHRPRSIRRPDRQRGRGGTGRGCGFAGRLVTPRHSHGRRPVLHPAVRLLLNFVVAELKALLLNALTGWNRSALL